LSAFVEKKKANLSDFWEIFPHFFNAASLKGEKESG